MALSKTRKFNFHVPGFQGVFLGVLFGNRIGEKTKRKE
jgi:hypothetical protein